MIGLPDITHRGARMSLEGTLLINVMGSDTLYAEVVPTRDVIGAKLVFYRFDHVRIPITSDAATREEHRQHALSLTASGARLLMRCLPRLIAAARVTPKAKTPS